MEQSAGEMAEHQLMIEENDEAGGGERAELSPWGTQRTKSEEGEMFWEGEEVTGREGEHVIAGEGQGGVIAVVEAMESEEGEMAGVGKQLGRASSPHAPTLAAASAAAAAAALREGLVASAVGPGSPRVVKTASPARSRTQLGSSASASGRRRVGGRGRGKRELAALRRLPTPPIFVLLDNLYQAQGIVHMRAQLHVKVVNQGTLQSPVEAADFELIQLSGPLPLDYEVRALSRPSVFRVEYSARMAGLFTFKLACRGRSMHRQSEPLTLQVSKPTTCAENCIAKGADLRLGTAGQRGNFEIIMRDQLGYPRTSCPEQFAMGITGPAKCQSASIGEFLNGRLPVLYNITKTGVYKVSILMDDCPIGGSPYYLEIRAGEPSLERTRVVLPTPTLDSGSACHMRAGQPGLLSVACYDVYGNLNTGGRCEVQLSMYNQAYPNVKLFGRPLRHRMGSYEVEFLPEVAGRYVLQGELKVGADWKPLYHISDQVVVVGAGCLDPTCCFICSETAAGTRGVSTVGVVGEWLEFSLQGVDTFGNVCKERVLGSAALRVASQSVDSPDLHTDIEAVDSVQQEMDYGEDGTITFRYRVVVAGRYMCQVLVNDAPIGSSPQQCFTYFSPGAADPSRCVLTTSGFQDGLVGVCASVTLETRDVFGNRLGYGGLELSVDVSQARENASLTESIRTLGDPAAMRSATQAEVTIADDDSGRYLITILPKEAGLHMVNVMYKHTQARQDTLLPINPDPLMLSVSSASTMARGLTIPGNSFRKAVAGQQQCFTMWSLEPGTNSRQTEGGERFTLHLAMLPGTSRQALLADEVEGHRRRRRGKKAAGGVDGKASINRGKVPDPLLRQQSSSTNLPPRKAASSLKTVSISALAAGQRSDIDKRSSVNFPVARALSMRGSRRGALLGLDQRGRGAAATGHQLSEEEEEVLDTETISTTVVDNGDGSYTVSYTPRHAAVYLLRVSRNGIPVPFSMARTLVHVHPTKMHGPSTVLHGPGLRRAEVGTLAMFRLQLCDRFRNMVPDEAKAHRVRIEVYKEFVPSEQEEDTLLPVTLTDTGAGQYEARFSAEQSGSYMIEVELNGVVHKELERRVMFTPTTTDPAKCILSGIGLHRAAAGYVGRLSIKTHDRFGNERQLGGDTFEATMQLRTPGPGLNQELPAGALKLKVVDAKNGQYEVFYRVKIAGSYLLRVVFANHASAKQTVYSGLVNVVQAAPCAERCTATGPGLSGPAAHISVKVNVLVLDAFGNCVPLGTEPPEEVTRLGQDLQAAVQARKQSGGVNGKKGHQRGRFDADAVIESMEAKLNKEAAVKNMMNKTKDPSHRDDDDGDDEGNSVGGDDDEQSDGVSDDSAAGSSRMTTTTPLTTSKGHKGFLGLLATLNSADAEELVRTVCTVAKAEPSTEAMDGMDRVNKKGRGGDDDEEEEEAAAMMVMSGGSSANYSNDNNKDNNNKGLSSYVLKFTPPRAGLFMLEVVLNGTHILGSPFRIQVHEEHVLGAHNAGNGGLDHLAEQALMFARMRRSQGVLVYNRKLGDPTTTGHVASVDTSLIKSGVWDASTSSLLKQVGLNPTVTTAAARIAELEQMQRYEMRKQSALMHLRIANLKHTFGESFEEDETYERGVLGPTLLEKRRKEAGMGRDDNDEQRRRVAADADIVGRPRRSSDSVLPPMLSDERLSSSQQLRVGSLSERELRGSENGYQVDSRLLRPAGSMKHKKPLVAKARSSGDTQPSTSGNSPYPPVMGRPPQAGSYVDNLSTLLDGVARL